ncbi:hypothetical protein BS47DRAFT_182129 [Hydnum rufescens UP504]|uniref:Uncharacterized protein n=1 Tax=Hydnum rufescens UP504 TaxID=1448309 RepID=A0A9P6DNK1_9AGAM|nr:hypothetical protein BS47DRAFT_182129 [Hydnum rufescens UP504]
MRVRLYMSGVWAPWKSAGISSAWWFPRVASLPGLRPRSDLRTSPATGLYYGLVHGLLRGVKNIGIAKLMRTRRACRA